MSSDLKPEVEHHGGVAARPSRKRGCANHCKRFWWAHLIVFCIAVILIVTLVIFVGVPKIAQSKINEAELEIEGVNIFDTTPESYTMEVNSTITTDGKIHAQIDGFTGSMYLEDLEGQPTFATLDFPETNADKHQVVNISQHVDIADMDAFTTFNIWFANNETVRLTIEGDTKVKPKGLDRKSSVNFKKTLEVKGLNLFKGTQVTGGKISLEDDEEGYNFHGTADIPNASHFTLDIGNLTFRNFIEDTDVGTLDVQNLVLVPGTNTVDLKGKLDQPGILKFAQSEAYCETVIIPFKLLGDKVTNHGQDLPYFLAGLAYANQTVEMDIGKVVKESLNIDIKCGE